MVDREKRIQELAYHLWVKGGRPHGQSDRHWHEAVALFEAERAEPKNEVTEKEIDVGATKPMAAAQPASESKSKAAPAKSNTAKPKAAPKSSTVKASVVGDMSLRPTAEKSARSNKRKSDAT